LKESALKKFFHGALERRENLLITIKNYTGSLIAIKNHRFPSLPSSYYGPVHSAYNPSFSACFFSQNSIFLSQQISQQCFSAGLLAQPNDSYI
jgi:hypothetical protein